MGCQHKKHTAEGDSIIDRIRLNILGLLSINEVLITAICIIHLHLIYLLFIVKLSSLELSQASGLYYCICWIFDLVIHGTLCFVPLLHGSLGITNSDNKMFKEGYTVWLSLAFTILDLILTHNKYWETANRSNFFCVNVFHLKTACGSNLSNQSFFAPLCIKEKVQSVHFSPSWINKFRKCTLNKIWAP